MNNHKKFKRQHYNTDKDDNNSSSSFGFEADDKSMEMIGDADNVNELKLKMTALEVQILSHMPEDLLDLYTKDQLTESVFWKCWSFGYLGVFWVLWSLG
jgi:hypothetical protein